MDRLAAMEAFVRVVEAGSFSEAARRSRQPKSGISKQVQALERHLDARLLERTTRRLSLTEAGSSYLAWCTRILADVAEAENAAQNLHGTPAGLLRVDAPVSFGHRFVAPLVPDFMAMHPTIRLDVSLNDRYVDLVEEGIDVAIRLGTLEDSSLVARRLGACRRIAVASPEYLERHGRPRTPDEIVRHACMVYDRGAATTAYRFRVDGRDVTCPVDGPLTANNGDLLLAACLAGHGIYQAPSFFFGDALAQDRLVTLLEEYEPQPVGVYAVYAQNRQISAKVRAFVDYLVTTLKPTLEGMA